MQKKLAKIVSLALGLPWIIVLVYILLTQVHLSQEQLFQLLGVSVVFHIVVPGVYLFWAMKTGKIADLDITKREQRFGILTVLLLSYFSSLFIIQRIGNDLLFHIFAIILAYISVVYIITFFWKISLHMGVNVLSVILVNYFYGWNMPWLYLAIPLIFWSRYTLRKHTPLQLVIGALVSGSVVFGGLKVFGYI